MKQPDNPYQLIAICGLLGLCVQACSKERVPKESPQSQDQPADASSPIEPPMTPDATPAAPPVDATPPSAAIAELMGKIAALRSPLGTPAEVEKALGMGAFQSPAGNRRVQQAKFVDGSSWYLLTLTMEDGTWERPRGHSAYRGPAARIASVALHGPGSIQAPLPPDARTLDVLATPPAYDLSTSIPAPMWDGAGKAGKVQHWGTGHYFAQGGRNVRSWYFGFHQRPAEFAYTRKQVDDTEAFLIKVLEGAKGSADVGSFLKSQFARQAKGDVYRGGLAAVSPAAAKVLSVHLDIPLPMPAFFAETGAKEIMTSFAHDYGDSAEPLEGNGLRIMPSRYFCRDRDRGMTDGACSAADARWQDFSIDFQAKE